ncbi:uncharacterized protein LOC133722668 [Rosa rugosa]|uniref:uncharacterized protein LOC133722668 n=1 Tax=Rosa rugosa TaxID=74645 RepID=UPI002B40685C|nr:uncharacterized protein LOC133722668 [Rosa rugosa]
MAVVIATTSIELIIGFLVVLWRRSSDKTSWVVKQLALSSSGPASSSSAARPLRHDQLLPCWVIHSSHSTESRMLKRSCVNQRATNESLKRIKVSPATTIIAATDLSVVK